FRFYDPDIGRFISPDPIGLEGSTNWFAYAPNPISWIDPLGWSGKGDYGRMIPIKGYQKHHIIPQNLANHPAIISSGYDVHNIKNMVYLPTSGAIDPDRTVHRGMHVAQYDEDIKKVLNRIDANNASPEIKRMQIQALSDNFGGKLRTNQMKLNSAC
ncbi:MAG: AHH domain-containing protein, partial [Telluria sp.]